MAEPHIGYYVHHHGAGHGVRALAIAQALPLPVTLFGSRLPGGVWPAHVRGVELPPDTAEGQPLQTPEGLHYAPLGVPGLRQRMALMAQWLDAHWPCLLVVDVSVEVALLARLCSVPHVYVRQHGERCDAAHALAYASATGLLAPYPAVMAPTHDRWAEKTVHCGWVSRYNGASAGTPVPGRVLVICGHGGTGLSAGLLEAAAVACPQWQFQVAGALASGRALPNLHWLGPLSEPLAALQQAEVVIGSASDSLVSEAAALGCRYIAVAEARPFAEQRAQARQLQAQGLALGLEQGWPLPAQWPGLLAQARRQRSEWREYAAPGNATLASEALLRWCPRR